MDCGTRLTTKRPKDKSIVSAHPHREQRNRGSIREYRRRRWRSRCDRRGGTRAIAWKKVNACPATDKIAGASKMAIADGAITHAEHSNHNAGRTRRT